MFSKLYGNLSDSPEILQTIRKFSRWLAIFRLYRNHPKYSQYFNTFFFLTFHNICKFSENFPDFIRHFPEAFQTFQKIFIFGVVFSHKLVFMLKHSGFTNKFGIAMLSRYQPFSVSTLLTPMSTDTHVHWHLCLLLLISTVTYIYCHICLLSHISTVIHVYCHTWPWLKSNRD